jgi:hypothetical protein
MAHIYTLNHHELNHIANQVKEAILNGITAEGFLSTEALEVLHTKYAAVIREPGFFGNLIESILGKDLAPHTLPIHLVRIVQ